MTLGKHTEGSARGAGERGEHPHEKSVVGCLLLLLIAAADDDDDDGVGCEMARRRRMNAALRRE